MDQLLAGAVVAERLVVRDHPGQTLRIEDVRAALTPLPEPLPFFG